MSKTINGEALPQVVSEYIAGQRTLVIRTLLYPTVGFSLLPVRNDQVEVDDGRTMSKPVPIEEACMLMNRSDCANSEEFSAFLRAIGVL